MYMISKQSLGRENNCILSLKIFWLLNKVVATTLPLQIEEHEEEKKDTWLEQKFRILVSSHS